MTAHRRNAKWDHEGNGALRIRIFELAFRLLRLRPLRPIDVVRIQLFVLFLLLLRTIFPDLTLIRRKALPLLANRFGQIGLPLLLRGSIGLLCCGLSFFATMTPEKNEGVLGSFDIILIALFWPVLEFTGSR